MTTNSSITIYHKVYNTSTHVDNWVRYTIENAMIQINKGATTTNGYIKSDSCSIFIPYNQNNLDGIEINIGDIVCKGIVDSEITKQSDLTIDNYNITNIVDNNYGSSTVNHLYIGAN